MSDLTDSCKNPITSGGTTLKRLEGVFDTAKILLNKPQSTRYNMPEQIKYHI